MAIISESIGPAAIAIRVEVTSELLANIRDMKAIVSENDLVEVRCPWGFSAETDTDGFESEEDGRLAVARERSDWVVLFTAPARFDDLRDLCSSPIPIAAIESLNGKEGAFEYNRTTGQFEPEETL